MALKRITFNFSLSDKKGLMEVFFGKGALACFSNLFIIMLLTVGFFLIPFELDSLIIRFFILLILIYNFHLFIKTAIEIVVEEKNIQFRTFQRYRKFPFSRIRLIKIYYFWTALMSTIIVKTKDKSTRYYLWVPRFGERYDLFLKLVETLKEKAKGRFEFKYKT